MSQKRVFFSVSNYTSNRAGRDPTIGNAPRGIESRRNICGKNDGPGEEKREARRTVPGKLTRIVGLLPQGSSAELNALMAQGEELAKQEKYQEALQEFEEAIKHAVLPADKFVLADAYYFKALLFMNNREYQEALPLLSSVIDLDPEHPMAKEMRNRILLAQRPIPFN
ncbi:MAG TPA: tetratricopeptide repeat protein [Ktedonobacteraceae bacterium]|jgi:tetratricopeptide (TPR) repeat protein